MSPPAACAGIKKSRFQVSRKQRGGRAKVEVWPTIQNNDRPTSFFSISLEKTKLSRNWNFRRPPVGQTQASTPTGRNNSNPYWWRGVTENIGSAMFSGALQDGTNFNSMSPKSGEQQLNIQIGRASCRG